MFRNDEAACIRYCVNNYPPVLETIAVKTKEDDIGLTPNGRTVTWMKSAQLVVMGIFSNASGVIGLLLGALTAIPLAFYNHSCDGIKQHIEAFSEYGKDIGIFVGAQVGRVVASIVVPPISGSVNLFSHLRERINYHQMLPADINELP